MRLRLYFASPNTRKAAGLPAVRAKSTAVRPSLFLRSARAPAFNNLLTTSAWFIWAAVISAV